MSVVTGMRRSNPWMSRALSMRGIESQEVEGEADIKVFVDTLYFTNHGPRSNYRPVLHVRGQLVGLVPYGSSEIAYGVTEVAFDREMEGGNVTVDSFYEFTDEQLVALVQKGFFNEGFEPPNDLLNQIWELPAHYKGIVIAPRNEQEAPLAFLDVLDRDGLIIDAMTSGLDLVDYFPDYLTEIRSRDQENDKTVDHVLERTDHVNDIFAGTESQYDDEGTDGRVNEAEGASITQALSGESVTKNVLPVMDSPLFDALMRNTQITLGNEKFEDALTNESQTGSTFSVTDELKAAEDQQATITTAGLASTFREVMGDFIDSSVTKNTPAPEVINPVDTETEIGVPEGPHESVTEVKRDLERKRASVRENVEVVTKEDINSLSFNEEPDF
jgi:hypothetical protein